MSGALLLASAQQAPLQPLHDRQQLVAITVAVAILVLVVELVRRRKLREEYSWVWILVALMLLALATVDGLIVEISGWIGSATSTSTLFFGGLVFVLLLALQFSVRLSKLTHRCRALAQRATLLERQFADLREELGLADQERPGAESVDGRDAPPATPRDVRQLHPTPDLRDRDRDQRVDGGAG